MKNSLMVPASGRTIATTRHVSNSKYFKFGMRLWNECDKETCRNGCRQQKVINWLKHHGEEEEQLFWVAQNFSLDAPKNKMRERRVWHGKGKTLHIVHETFKSVIRWKVALFPPKQYWNQNKYFILISIDFNTRMCFFAFFFRSFRLAFRYSKTEGYRDISIWSFAFKKKTPRRRRKTFPPCSEHKTSRRGTFCLNPSAKFLILKQKFGIKCQQSEKHIIWAYLAALIGSVWSSRRNSSSRSSPAW